MTTNNTLKTVIIVAMEVEAKPIIEQIGMHELSDIFDPRLPMIAYEADQNANIILVTNGKCPVNQCDRIGTQAAAVTAWESIRVLNPDLIISAGTAGGFKQHQTEIGDVYLSNEIKYHNRRAPFPEFEQYLLGNYGIFSTSEIANKLGMKSGLVSSGDSVYAEQDDLKFMTEHGTRCKEMEAAAIAEIAQLANIDMFAIKVITDFVDLEHCPYEQFMKNYRHAIERLKSAVANVLNELYNQALE